MTINPIAGVIVCDIKDRSRPMVLVSCKENRDAAETGAQAMYQSPPGELDEFESEGMKDVLIGGIKEWSWEKQRLIYGVDRDAICYGLIGNTPLSSEEAVMFLKKVAMRLTLKIHRGDYDTLTVAAKANGRQTIMELCQQYGEKPSITWKGRMARASTTQKKNPLIPGLRYVLKFYYGRDRLWTGTSPFSGAVCRGTYTFPQGFMADSTLPLIPKEGAAIGEYSWKRDSDNLVVYFPNYWGVCYCVVTAPECSLYSAIDFLENARTLLKNPNNAKMDILLSKSCPHSKFAFRSTNKEDNDDKWFIKLWENVAYINEKKDGISMTSLGHLALLGSPSSLSRIEESHSEAKPNATETKLHHINGRQMEKFGLLAQKSPRVFLPRDRSRLLSRRLPRPNPPVRQESNGISRISSTGDDLSSQWETGSYSGSEFEWVDFHVIEDMPALFPYHVPSGISIPGHFSSAGSRASTIRTKSCETIVWRRTSS